MHRDYRIGLIAGSVLAGVALLWIATRPSLSPRPQLPAPSQNTDGSLPGADRLAVQENTAATASETSTPRPDSLPQSKMDDAAEPTFLRGQASNPPSPTVPADETPTRFHVVRPGETLSSIAQQYYGSTSQWRKIVEANQNIKDANRISPGMKLIIPR